MASKPETTFTASVHKRLPSQRQLHREKMNNPYRSGTADVWYSGTRSDLWIEYKFIVLPKRPTTVITDYGVSPLQDDWIRSRRAEGRDVWIVVGCKAGAVVFDGNDWPVPMTAGAFAQLVQSRDELARAIQEHCMV